MPANTAGFLDQFIYGDGWLTIAVGHPSNLARYSEQDIPQDTDAFFGPATRRDESGTKESVVGSKALWIDVDDQSFPQPTFPPTYVVYSGHGWHLYWLLSEPIQSNVEIETHNRTLIDDVPTADKACWNANRVLRIPGSTNTNNPRAGVELRRQTRAIYRPDDFVVLTALGSKTRHKIRTGDRRGYRSRSERDWAVVNDLVEAGATDALIKIIFEHQPVGDKHRDPRTNRGYLDHTIKQARDRVLRRPAGEVEEQTNGYYDLSRGKTRRLSTFTIHPELLLDGSSFGAVDAILGDVTADGTSFRWRRIAFTRTAFTSVAKFDREAPVAAWQWLGRDDDIRHLLPFLMKQLQEKGMPRVLATPTLGLYQVGADDKWYFVGDTVTIGATDIWENYDGPIASLPTGRERPRLRLSQPTMVAGNSDDRPYRGLGDLVQRLNEPETIWPAIGWYAAAPLKPWFESNGYRFPILNVSGTRGSGKTTLIKLMMDLFGQYEPRTYDAGTTRFVTLALLGSSNAVPIAFSEFRYAAVQAFLRYILLAYDTGHDPRGRADQTTVDYPLSAPFSVDGEDLITDPAAQERIVVVQMHPEVIAEGSDAYETHSQLTAFEADTFGRDYIQGLIWKLDQGTLEDELKRARGALFEVLPRPIPDRIRNNHIAVYLGIRLFTAFTGLDCPEPDVLLGSIQSVYNIGAGRGRTLADDFVEAAINAVSQGVAKFKYSISDDGKQLWFQMATAYAWWLQGIRSQGRTALEKQSLLIQLKESPYYLESEMQGATWMHGIDLHKAQGAGLDIPGRFAKRR